MKNWTLVANAARARLFEAGERPGSLQPLQDLVHPSSRQKGIELARDRPGHVEGTGHGLGSTAYVPKTDPRDREHDHFAQTVAQILNEGIAAGRCAGIVLVASNPFLGRVRSHLSPQADHAVLRTVPHDYTGLPEQELARRIGS